MKVRRWRVELMKDGHAVMQAYLDSRTAAENAAREWIEYYPARTVVVSEAGPDGKWWARYLYQLQRRSGKVAWSVERLTFRRKEMLGGMEGTAKPRAGRGVTMTRELAWAAATDAATRHARAARRTRWNRADLYVAVQTFKRLWPQGQTEPLAELEAGDPSCGCAPPAVSWVTLGLSVATTAALGVVAFQTWKVLRGAQQVLEVVDTVHGAVKRLAGTT